MKYRKLLFYGILAFAVVITLPFMSYLLSSNQAEKLYEQAHSLYNIAFKSEARAQAAPPAACGVMHRIGETAVFVVSSDPDVKTKEGCEKDTYWKKTIWLDDVTVKAIFSKDPELARKNPEVASGAKAIGDAERNEAAASFCSDQFNNKNKCVHLYDYDPTADAQKKKPQEKK